MNKRTRDILRLRCWTIEPKTFEVAACIAGRAKEYLATLIQNGDFVEELWNVSFKLFLRRQCLVSSYLIRCLWTLIDGYAGSCIKHIALCSQRLTELYGVGRVETSSRIVPAL